MKALGVIPARKGSHRFPDKHHAVLQGKPMFEYTIDAALAARGLDRVIIATDDERLEELGRSRGILTIARPPELAADTAPLDDAIRHVCTVLRERDAFVPDVVVTMQGNVPVRKPGQIDEAIEHLQRFPDATAVCTAQALRFRPEWAKVIVDQPSGLSAPYLPSDGRFRTQDFKPLFAMDGAIYAVRRETLERTAGNRKTHAWFGEGLHLLVQEHEMYSLEVDYPDQADLAEYYLARIAQQH